MFARRRRTSAVAVIMSALVASGAALAGPSAAAVDPNPSGVPGSSSSPTSLPASTYGPVATEGITPSPSPSPTATPTEPPAPSQPAAPQPAPSQPPLSEPDPVSGLKPGATEVASARTEYSQTYDNHDGTTTTQFYASPVFYQPDGSAAWVPIEVGFAATPGSDYFVSAKAPVAVTVSPTSASGDFLSTTYGGQTIGFRLPADVAKASAVSKPAANGPVADYTDLMPGVDLRVIANAHGAKSFFIWNAAPTDATLRYVVDAPGLSLSAEQDGSVSVRNKSGEIVATIPGPYAVDSTPDPLSGSGHYTDAVKLMLDPDGKTVTVSVDPTWLKSAVYPAPLAQ